MNQQVKYFGVDYYPEHWPEDRWPVDADMMRDIGFNLVRMAEFAWQKMETSEGTFDFAWLARALETLHARGISAVLGTPTAAAPAWLMQAHPEIFRVDEHGHRASFGARQFMCVNAPAFRQASRRIVTAMARELGQRDSVIAWQIDNEFGVLCYCDICRSEFQQWCLEKYGSLEALNHAWGTVFWSQTYTDWAQIPVPMTTAQPPNPGLYLDYRRFMADSYATFQREQIRIIREHSPGRPITHNFMGFYPDALDYHKLAEDLDFVSWDNYPQVWSPEVSSGVSLSHDFIRGMKKKPFWVMEEQSGPGGWGTMGTMPRPGQIRQWTRQAIAHGAEGIVYFRWRPARFGAEQYWHGILNHDGTPGRRFEEIKQIAEDIRRGDCPKPPRKPGIALLVDADSRFALKNQPGNPEFSYYEHVLHYYRNLEVQVGVLDVIPADSDLGGYHLVIAPTLYVLKPEVALKLRDYVHAGGVLITTFRTGVKDEYNRIVNEPLPGLLREVCGVEVEDYHSPFADEVNKIKGRAGKLPRTPSSARIWLDVLKPTGAEVLAEYHTGFASGYPAITMNRFGDGRAIYIGTWVERQIIVGMT